MRKKSLTLLVTSLPDYQASALYEEFGYSSALKPVNEVVPLNSP